MLTIMISVLLFTGTGIRTSAVTGKYLNQGYTAEEIAAKYASLKIPDTTALPYSTQPKMTSPYNNTGDLNAAARTNALNILNFARYVAGLSDVVLDSDYNSECQAGAYVMAVNNSFSHTPTNSTGMDETLFQKGYGACGSSNISWGYPETEAGPAMTVLGYLDDSDSGNIDRVGHRRWALNPKMGKTGFGLVGKYAAMKAFDSSNTTASKQYVAWPAAGYFPVELFENPSTTEGQAWSISLDSKTYGKSYSDSIIVTLTNKKTSLSTVFQKGFTNVTGGKYFGIEKSGYGMDYCVIFRPESSFVSIGDEYSVKISGLKDTKGAAAPDITYDTAFFSAADPDRTEADYIITVSADKPSIENTAYVKFYVTVKDKNGSPISGLTVKAWVNQSQYYRLTTDETGTAQIQLQVTPPFTQNFTIEGKIIGSTLYRECNRSITITNGSQTSVTGVKLNKSALGLSVPGEETLTAAVEPADATDKELIWSSGNPNIATVDQNGKVTAVSEGITTVTVTTKDGGKTDQCIVTVTATLVSITLKTPSKLTYIQNEEFSPAGGAIVYKYNGKADVTVPLTTAMCSGFDMSKTGEQTVSVMYVDFKATFKITVLPSEGELAKGDVNGDSIVSLKDATLIQKYLASISVLTDKQKTAGDVNGDGSLSLKDATTIQKFLAGIIPSL